MSMNFSEFKKLIGADPWNRDPETLRARNSAAEFEAAAAEAEAFEKKLQSALDVQAPSGLLDELKRIAEQPARKRNWMPLAMAASLVLAVGAAGLAWQQSHQWDSIEEYLADHYSHDGSSMVAQATGVAGEQEINSIMTRFGAVANKPLSGTIQRIKLCPTPDGKGAHMVVHTDQGPMTIIFMPETQVNDGEMIDFEQMHALLVNLEHGSAAIIGNKSQAPEKMENIVRKSLKTGLVGA